MGSFSIGPGRKEAFGIVKFSAETLLDLLFPANIYCVCCGDTMDSSRVHGLCDKCAQKLDWLPDDPFHAVLDNFAFDSVTACCRYGFYVRQIMNKLKLGGEGYIAEGLGKLMGERMKLEEMMNAGVCPSASGAYSESPSLRKMQDPDSLSAEQMPSSIVTCVPMHRDKLRKRGYNQAELLAKAAAKELGLPYADLLIKQKPTASMRGSDAQTRRGLLTDSFSLTEEASKLLRDKHIILVDDVMTTGSTADVCARLLRSGGAARVDVLCFAVSGSPSAGAEETADFEFPGPEDEEDFEFPDFAFPEKDI